LGRAADLLRWTPEQRQNISIDKLRGLPGFEGLSADPQIAANQWALQQAGIESLGMNPWQQFSAAIQPSLMGMAAGNVRDAYGNMMGRRMQDLLADENLPANFQLLPWLQDRNWNFFGPGGTSTQAASSPGQVGFAGLQLPVNTGQSAFSPFGQGAGTDLGGPIGSQANEEIMLQMTQPDPNQALWNRLPHAYRPPVDWQTTQGGAGQFWD
jgi:hypothetical protein